MNLWQDEMSVFVPAAYRIRRAEHAFELLGHHRLRRAFFCDEQRLFDRCDRDAIDAHAIPIVAVSCVLGDVDEVIGTVRIHEQAPGIWWGSRLCVSRALRGAAAIGSALVQTAIGMALAEGCTEFLAHVQAQNAELFTRLGWIALEEVPLHGRPHLRMRADLARFRPTGTDRVLHLPPLRAQRPLARTA